MRGVAPPPLCSSSYSSCGRSRREDACWDSYQWARACVRAVVLDGSRVLQSYIRRSNSFSLRCSLSSCFLRWHSSLFSFSTYTLFYVLMPLATTCPEFIDFILQSLDVNTTSHPLSHIWITLSRLCFSQSTSRTSWDFYENININIKYIIH